MVEYRFGAIYFRMGTHNEDDGKPELVGLDCPFGDDSLVLVARDKDTLAKKVKAVRDGVKDIKEEFGKEYDHDWEREYSGDFERCYPDVIVDADGVIQIELQRELCSDPAFDPEKVLYSYGRENLKEFWEREKWRWIGFE